MSLKSLHNLCFIFVLFMPFLISAQDDCSVTGFTVESKKTPTSAYSAYQTRTLCQLPDFYENAPNIRTNIYGSRIDKKTTATGFYRVEQIDGRWWVVDPDGYLSICRAVNAVSQGTGTTSKNTFTTKFATTTNWMNKTKDLLTQNGFYCAGAWSAVNDIKNNPNQATKPFAYTVILNWMSGYGAGRTTVEPGHAGYPYNCIFVFEKEFAEYCENQAKNLAANKNDKNLFGYYTDNELPFYNKTLNNFLRKGKSYPTDEGYLATLKWMSDNGYTANDTTNSEVQKKFLGFVAETYFSITNNALKKYDPNHMNLGSRVNVTEARENKYFMQAAGPHVDILAVNYYGVWTPNIAANINWGKNLGKPFMVTEFYTKGDDVPGLANASGAGWIVKTQADRGWAYQNYTLALLESKYCVGWHWFKYMDNDPSIPNAEPSNIDANKGIVNTAYEPYADLMDKMRDLNLKVYNIIDYFDSKSPVTKIYPEADAYFKGYENFGSADRLGIKLTSDIAYFRESFLRFNLNGQTANIGNVNLRLFVLASGDANKTYKAEFVSDDNWTESGISYTQRPSGVYEIGRWKHGSDVTLDVSQSFIETVNSDKKLSIKLSAVDVSSGQLEYASRENSTVDLRPHLEIVQSGAVHLSNLSDLFINDKRLVAFHPDTLVYNILLPENTTVNPKIEFSLPNLQMQTALNNVVHVQSAAASDRTATISVTSANGSVQRTYTLIFHVGTISSLFSISGKNQASLTFNIFPNPLSQSNTLTLQIPSIDNESSEIAITDLGGRNVFMTNMTGSSSTLNPDGLNAGMYFISIKNLRGSSTKKLIVN